MTKGTEPVRTTRLEVVDRDGRPRVVIGALTDDTDMVGVSVRDAAGLERLYLVADEQTCEAGVTGAGNNLAGVMVDNAANLAVFLASPDGTLLHTWPEGA